MITVGDRVRDTVTGFEGIAVATTTWLHGCVRVSVQPETLTDAGAVKEQHSFDEPQLLLVDPAAVVQGSRATDGPRPEPARRPDPAR